MFNAVLLDNLIFFFYSKTMFSRVLLQFLIYVIYLFDHKTTETPFTVSYVQMAIENIYYMCFDRQNESNWKIRTALSKCITFKYFKRNKNHYNKVN